MPELPNRPLVPTRVVAAVIVLLAGLCWWWLSEDVVPPPRGEEVLSEQPASAVVVPDVAVVERDLSQRSDEAPPFDFGEEPPDADLEHPYEFALAVHLRGPFGLPVDGATVLIAPDLAGFSAWPEQSVAGRVEASWRGRVRVMQVHVAVLVWGVLQPMRMVTVESGERSHLAVAVSGRDQNLAMLAKLTEMEPMMSEQDAKAARRVLQEVRQAQRKRRERLDPLDFVCGRSMPMFKLYRCTECHDRSQVSAYQSVARSGSMRLGLHPGSYFQDLHHKDISESAAAEQLEKVRSDLQQRKQAAAERLRGATVRLVGSVSTPHGQSVANVQVAWLSDLGSVVRVTTTDSAGKFVLGPLEGGEQRIVAAGGPLGMVDRVVRVAGRGVTHCDLELSANQFVIGRVLDEGGDPLHNWRVELVRDTAGFATVVRTDKAGQFAAYGVPGPVQCLVWPVEKDSVFPVLAGIEALVDASRLDIALHAEHPVRGRLRARASLPSDYDSTRIEARVAQYETGRVAPMKPFGFANEFVAEPLAPGRYRVQFGAPGLQWAERDVNVDGRGLWDIGGVHLAGPGRVRLQAAPGAPNVLEHQHALYRRTRSVDIRVDYQRDGQYLVVAPGKHVLVWRTTGELRAREFEVASGVDVVVPIWPE